MRTEDITFNHIKILKAVDDCGSFSKAAQKLQCSQAMISKKVKQLEDCFGVQLLSRAPGAIGLTYKGKKLISKIQDTVETVKSLQEEFQITLSAEGEDLLLGVTPLSEVWLAQNLDRFQLCFSGRAIRTIVVESGKFFADLRSLNFDALINGLPAYKERHHCTRLQTYQFLLVSFDPDHAVNQAGSIKSNEIDFTHVVLLEEIYHELSKQEFLDQTRLKQALVLNSYQQVLEVAFTRQKWTILPEFCQTSIATQYQASTRWIQDVNDYGIYIHVPHFGELLVSAESLVRSFRLDQRSLADIPQIYFTHNNSSIRENNLIRIGIQRDSIGQLIASYGTKYIFDRLKLSSFKDPNIKNIEIDRNFDLQIVPFLSGEQINQQMQRGQLEIAILDDISLLNNGVRFFNDFSFGSKLIGIASYNLFGQDIDIIVPKNSSIDTVPELRDKRISTLFGSNAHRFIITLFELYGMDVNQDCKLIDEDPRTGSTSLLNGHTDAYVCCNTFTAALTEYISARRLAADQMLRMNLPSLRGIVCRSQFIKENPKFVIAYLHALVMANHWFTSAPEKALATLSHLIGINQSQIAQFFSFDFGCRIDPTLKPQWSWLLKTLNRRLDGNYHISLFDVDFWVEDYYLRLVYNLLDLDYHFHQISFSNELSNSYYMEEKFNRYMKVIYGNDSVPSI